MSNVGGLFGLGRKALSNNQTALQTTSHNIANANTEGYSRQRVEQKTEPPVVKGGLRIGQGARVTSIQRITNQFLTKQIQEEGTKLGFFIGKDAALGRVEQIYNESINKGLNQFVSNFFNSFREFASNPESQGARAMVKEAGVQLAGDFHRINRQLTDIQRDLDFQISSQVQQINGYVREIADLNEQVQRMEVQGITANDERDRREMVLKKLGGLINISYGESKDGKISVTAGNTGVLVSGGEYRELAARATPAREGKREANFDIVYKANPYGNEFVMTHEIKNGELGGALEARDKIINDLHKKMDEIAYTVSTSVNALHMRGYDKYNQTGVLFFEPLDGQEGAAQRIEISSEIARDPSKVCGAVEANAPGDNRLANAIASLQNQTLFNNGTTSVDEFYNGMVGEFAVMKQKNGMIMEHEKSVVDQLNNIRESTSGVSLDEEATDMVAYQKAFDASARLIRVADEMLDTVLNLKRL